MGNVDISILMVENINLLYSFSLHCSFFFKKMIYFPVNYLLILLTLSVGFLAIFSLFVGGLYLLRNLAFCLWNDNIFELE